MEHFDFFRYDLNLLVAFDALYTERSVSRAARKVGIGQSGMSHALAKMREVFKDELFIRSSHGIAPTVLAMQISGPVRAVLQGAHAILVDRPSFDPATSEHRFVLAMPDAQQLIILVPLLKVLRERAPGMLIQTIPFERDRALEQVDDGAADLAIGVFTEEAARRRAVALYRDRHVCIFNPRLVPLSGPKLAMKDYLAYPHLLLSHARDVHGVVDAALEKRKLRRKVIATTPYSHALPFLLKDIAAIGIVPRLLALRCARLMGLSVAEPPIDTGGITVTMAWHLRNEGDRAHQWLRTEILAISGSL
jgi:LysR family transcriptional regulator, mexEF-oprN operon transcriptional activator